MNRRLSLAVLLLGAVAVADEDVTATLIPSNSSEREPLLTMVPVYPEKARRARVEGEVRVCFNINRKGKTSRVAVRTSTNRAFEKPSRHAVQASTFHPLEADKKLSGVKSCRTFRFLLSPIAIQVPEPAPG